MFFCKLRFFKSRWHSLSTVHFCWPFQRVDLVQTWHQSLWKPALHVPRTQVLCKAHVRESPLWAFWWVLVHPRKKIRDQLTTNNQTIPNSHTARWAHKGKGSCSTIFSFVAIFQVHLGSVRQHYHYHTAKFKLTASLILTPLKFLVKKVDLHSLKLTLHPWKYSFRAGTILRFKAWLVQHFQKNWAAAPKLPASCPSIQCQHPASICIGFILTSWTMFSDVDGVDEGFAKSLLSYFFPGKKHVQLFCVIFKHILSCHFLSKNSNQGGLEIPWFHARPWEEEPPLLGITGSQHLGTTPPFFSRVQWSCYSFKFWFDCVLYTPVRSDCWL